MNEPWKGKTFITTNFSLNSKRLKFYQLQVLANALDLPSASSDDMLVMISGKLTESNHDPSDVQIVVKQTEEREELSLEDFNGIFLTVQVSRTDLTGASLDLEEELSVPTLVSDSARTTSDLGGESLHEFVCHGSQEKESFLLKRKIWSKFYTC